LRDAATNRKSLILVLDGGVDVVVIILTGGDPIQHGFPSLLPTEMELGRDTDSQSSERINYCIRLKHCKNACNLLPVQIIQTIDFLIHA